MKVLVIDDDAAVRQSLCRVLEGANYQVILAKDGQQAVERFKPGEVGLVILDLGLPIRDGWDVFERITSQSPTLPIIIVTGQANKRDVAVAAGVGALMEKPMDAQQLLETISHLLAEPVEARLRRLCGHTEDLHYYPSSEVSKLQRLRYYHPAPARRRIAGGTPWCTGSSLWPG